MTLSSEDPEAAAGVAAARGEREGEAGDGGDAGERLEVLLERHGDSFPSVCDCEI